MKKADSTTPMVSLSTINRLIKKKTKATSMTTISLMSLSKCSLKRKRASLGTNPKMKRSKPSQSFHQKSTTNKNQRNTLISCRRKSNSETDFLQWFGFSSKCDPTCTKESSTRLKKSKTSFPETPSSNKSRPKSRPEEKNSLMPMNGSKDNSHWSTQETLSTKESTIDTGTDMSRFLMKTLTPPLITSKKANSFHFLSPRLSTLSSPSSSSKIKWNKPLPILRIRWKTQQKMKLFWLRSTICPKNSHWVSFWIWLRSVEDFWKMLKTLTLLITSAQTWLSRKEPPKSLLTLRVTHTTKRSTFGSKFNVLTNQSSSMSYSMLRSTQVTNHWSEKLLTYWHWNPALKRLQRATTRINSDWQ